MGNPGKSLWPRRIGWFRRLRRAYLPRGLVRIRSPFRLHHQWPLWRLVRREASGRRAVRDRVHHAHTFAGTYTDLAISSGYGAVINLIPPPSPLLFDPSFVSLEGISYAAASPKFFALAAHGSVKHGATVMVILRKRRQLTLVLQAVRGHRLVQLGAVRLGRHRAGRSQIRWNLKTNGHPLPAGRYQVTLSALNGKILSPPAYPGARTLVCLPMATFTSRADSFPRRPSDPSPLRCVRRRPASNHHSTSHRRVTVTRERRNRGTHRSVVSNEAGKHTRQPSMPSAGDLSTGAWRLDPSLSSVEFHVSHFWGLITVKGRFERYEGTLDLQSEPAVALTIEADSLKTGNRKRDQHLRSASFFDVEHYPQVRFVSDTAACEDAALRVCGRLHASGRSVPLELDATVHAVDNGVEIEAIMHAAHRELGMTWSPLGIVRPTSKLIVTGRLVRRGRNVT